MLGLLPPSPSVSAMLVQTGLPLLAKESHDVATTTLANAITPHLAFLLRSGKPLESEITTLIGKGMTNTKPTVRRVFCALTGRAFWDCGDLTSSTSLAFAHAVLPSFETNLKTIATNPLNSTASPLEGYIALAMLLGPFSRCGKFGKNYPLHFDTVRIYFS
jgi:hypothetical protein